MTSSPDHPQSNGKAESAVRAAKSILKKCRHSGDDAWLAVLEHRNTPTQGLNSSLAQRLFERYTRTVLPVAPSTPKPQPTDPSLAARLKSRQEQQAATCNRHATPLRPLVIGESVWVRLGQRWHPARVTRLGKTPRSYEVILTDGRKFRRNWRQLRPSAPAHADRYENNDDLEFEYSPDSSASIDDDEEDENRTRADPDDHEAPAIQPDFGQGTEVETQQPYTTRAGRVVRPPRWMDNYVHQAPSYIYILIHYQ